jgi:hypothetical protein
MARRSVAWNGAAWGCAAALSLAACGGQSFVLDADAGMDATSVTPQSDAASFELTIPCPGTTCPVDGGTCCTGTSAGSDSCTLAGGMCGTCNTSLKCARDSNCVTGPCCIGGTSQSGCTGGQVFSSTCRPLLGACQSNEARLCNPNLPLPCPLKSTCSTNASDLQKWGLPAGTSDYGVCVAN